MNPNFKTSTLHVGVSVTHKALKLFCVLELNLLYIWTNFFG